jgi:hypothetical protein
MPRAVVSGDNVVRMRCVVLLLACLVAAPALGRDRQTDGPHPGRQYLHTTRRCELHVAADARSAVIRVLPANKSVIIRTRLGQGEWRRVEVGRGPNVAGGDAGYLHDSCFDD